MRSLEGAKVRVELDVMVSVGVMDRTRVRITIRIKEMVGVHSIVTYSTLLLVCCNWICAPKPQSCQFLFNRWGFFTSPTNFCLYVSRLQGQWQQCPTPELVNTTTSKVIKQLRSKILQSSLNQIQTDIDEFYFWWKYILAKTYFCRHKLFLPVRFYHGKNVFSTVWRKPPNAATLEVTADWQEPMIPQHIAWSSIAHTNKQLDLWCSTKTYHHPNQPH